MHAKSLPLCPTLCNPMVHSQPGSSLHGVLQARTQEWVAMSYSRGSSQPRNWTCVSYVSCTHKWVLYHYHHLGSLNYMLIYFCCSCLCNFIFFNIWCRKRRLSLFVKRQKFRAIQNPNHLQMGKIKSTRDVFCHLEPRSSALEQPLPLSASLPPPPLYCRSREWHGTKTRGVITAGIKSLPQNITSEEDVGIYMVYHPVFWYRWRRQSPEEWNQALLGAHSLLGASQLTHTPVFLVLVPAALCT